MIRLHGYPVSNYFNVVRAALIEKDLQFEIVLGGAVQDEAFLARNPMGKIPMLETDEGHFAETVVILDYLDDRWPERSLRPAGRIARARGRQIVNIVQVYVEVPARTLFPGVFMGGSNTAAVVDAARATIDRATRALERLADPAPLLCGDTVSQADLFAFYNLDVVDRLTQFVWDRSILSETGLGDWHRTIAARDSSRVVLADFETYFTRYIADKGAAYRAATEGQPAHA